MSPPDQTPLQPPTKTSSASVSAAIHVLSTERAALAHLEQLYQTDPLAQENLARAVDQIVRSIRNGGKLVFCGVGKSGKIAQKLEATMNSVGVYSTFLHPTEALHGDLGMVRAVGFPRHIEGHGCLLMVLQNDTLLMISFSGRTSELILLLPHIPPTVPVIAITSHTHPSTCPLLSFHTPEMGILLPAPIHENEESSFGVSAPTSSTTVALSLGDALAIAAARRLHTSPGRGPAEVFKSFHPGGAIGAASAATTPMSMSTGSIHSDYLQARPVLSSTSSDPGPDDHQRLPTNTITPVPIDQIPTVSAPPNTSVRLLDILLTAIQHPNAKSWVFLSNDEIIPPRNIRSLSQSGNVDLNVADLVHLPFAIHRRDWLTVSSASSADEVRELVSNARSAGDSSVVVAVVEESSPGTCVGVLEAEELWADSG